MQEYISAYDEVCDKMEMCRPELTEVMAELTRSKAVFMEKITEQARHMAWISAVIYAKVRKVKGKLVAYAMKRVAAGAHIPTPWICACEMPRR